MRSLIFTLIGVLIYVPALAAEVTADTLSARGGDIRITPVTHASVQLEFAGRVIHVDPWFSDGTDRDYAATLPADIILITGAENDHLDLAAIRKVRHSGTKIVIPAAAKEKAPDGIVIANGESQSISGITIEAIASYDIIPGEPYHPSGRGNGYIVTLGGRRIYFSGVTECVPEVQALRNIDVAFLMMNLPHGRMTPTAAAACVEQFKPGVVYPYHYRTGNVVEFKDRLAGSKTEVRLRDWYPARPSK